MHSEYGLALTPQRALALEGYFALVQQRAPVTIGATEIRQWVRASKPGTRAPSEALIRETLLARALPHRPRGRPRNDTRQPVCGRVAAPPLAALPTAPPRPR
jgi:hypothetical protein